MKQFALAAILATVAATTVSAAEVASRKVTFPSNGETIVGTLYVPSDTAADTRRPGVIVAGAWTSIKEQMSGLYAKEMAERGFVALAFDYRGWGESSGTIRFKEDPAMKTADIIAAADFLSTLSEVDPDAINGLGICASAGYMADDRQRQSEIQVPIARRAMAAQQSDRRRGLWRCRGRRQADRCFAQRRAR
ncbi:alpha/beta hydrolase [Rhizobium sp. H4]|uniref:alpha/beta hydrolase n=1 Tax=Rhizobium sp. H4 TaxID=2035449 RepID=UPI001FE1C535|nr:alpha/beta hydrolase [Rhizobium sp. H4]